jgi:hypothetical protein
MANHVGINQLVYGSDRPVIEPFRTKYDATLQTNAARLIGAVAAHARVAA